MPDCLVCGKETATTNMGMDACRACTVFYRRNRCSRDKMQCLNGTRNCTDYRKGIYSCRKCRLDRFEAVIATGKKAEMKQAIDKNTTPSSSTSSSSSLAVSPEESPDRDPFDINVAIQGPSHYINTPPPIPAPSIIERIRRSYRTLNVMRRTAEFQFRGIFLDPFEADAEQYELIPCTYKIMNEATRILITGLIDFIPAVFPEFSELPIADKELLIRNYQKMFHFIDGSLRSRRRWGNANPVIYGTYTAFLSVDFAGHFFSDCDDRNNAAAAAQTLRERIQENIPIFLNQVAKLDPTEDEFLALLGLAFCSVETLECSDDIVGMATRYRNLIVGELNAHYRATIGEERGATRLGTLLCMLQDLRRTEMKLKSEYEIYRMLDVFDDETFMYKLQMHKSDD